MKFFLSFSLLGASGDSNIHHQRASLQVLRDRDDRDLAPGLKRLRPKMWRNFHFQASLLLRPEQHRAVNTQDEGKTGQEVKHSLLNRVRSSGCSTHCLHSRAPII